MSFPGQVLFGVINPLDIYVITNFGGPNAVLHISFATPHTPYLNPNVFISIDGVFVTVTTQSGISDKGFILESYQASYATNPLMAVPIVGESVTLLGSYKTITDKTHILYLSNTRDRVYDLYKFNGLPLDGIISNVTLSDQKYTYQITVNGFVGSGDTLQILFFSILKENDSNIVSNGDIEHKVKHKTRKSSGYKTVASIYIKTIKEKLTDKEFKSFSKFLKKISR